MLTLETCMTTQKKSVAYTDRIAPSAWPCALSSMTMTADDVMVSVLSKFMGIKLTTTFDDFDTK